MYQLTPFADIPLTEDLLEHLIDEHERIAQPRFSRLWRYFRNALAEPNAPGGSSGPPAQRAGLPRRLHDLNRPSFDDRFEREIVIENDIAWRIHTLVDFMFPKSPRIVSLARDADVRTRIEAELEAIIEANGGVRLWQDVALLGSVYGHVDLLVHISHDGRNRDGAAAQDPFHDTGHSGARSLDDRLGHAAPMISIEAVEAPRAIPLLDPDDYRRLDAYIVHYERAEHAVARNNTTLGRLLRRALLRAPDTGHDRETVRITQIISHEHTQRYENEQLVLESRNRLGRLPLVHIQNLSHPYRYEGLSDVEPLIPLQDELNTRLSDRANRVTMQSFRMWLGKGIDGFTDRPIGPGQMWMTDNENASIEGFGGDADSPSERAHIEELREALDKASGVTPAAAGHIKAKVGNLTSENALRISLMGTIAKIKRKRITYGRGIAELCDLLLHALHVSGRFATDPRDRRVEVIWPDPLPADESRRITDALAKAQLGVPLEILRAELGYGEG